MVIDTSTAGMLYILASVVLPIIVAVVTKQETLGKYKALVLLFLSSVTSVVYAWQEAAASNVDWDYKNVVVGALVTFVIAAAAHFGFWKPTEVGPTVQEKTSHIGV